MLKKRDHEHNAVCKAIDTIALVLVIIGALNWGMWGFFQIDVVSSILGGPSSVASRIIFGLVGLAGLWAITFFKKVCCCAACDNDKK